MHEGRKVMSEPRLNYTQEELEEIREPWRFLPNSTLFKLCSDLLALHDEQQEQAEVREASINESAEKLYWEFDERRAKGDLGEREIFKAKVILLFQRIAELEQIVADKDIAIGFLEMAVSKRETQVKELESIANRNMEKGEARSKIKDVQGK